MTERIAENFEVFVVSYFLLRRYPQSKRETLHLAYGNGRDLLRDGQALESLNPRKKIGGEDLGKIALLEESGRFGQGLCR